MCDYGERFEVEGEVRVHLSAVNEPPAIHTAQGTRFAVAAGDGWAPLRGLSFSDPDAGETQFLDAYGVPSDPLLTVTLGVARGRVSLEAVDGLAFSAGDGWDDTGELSA